jgi:hypothetical protein
VLDEQGSFSGTLSEKIDDAVSKMGEIGSNSLDHKIRDFHQFVKNTKVL